MNASFCVLLMLLLGSLPAAEVWLPDPEQVPVALREPARDLLRDLAAADAARHEALARPSARYREQLDDAAARADEGTLRVIERERRRLDEALAAPRVDHGLLLDLTLAVEGVDQAALTASSSGLWTFRLTGFGGQDLNAGILFFPTHGRRYVFGVNGSHDFRWQRLVIEPTTGLDAMVALEQLDVEASHGLRLVWDEIWRRPASGSRPPLVIEVDGRRRQVTLPAIIGWAGPVAVDVLQEAQRKQR